MRIGQQLLWLRPWTTTATNERMTAEEKHCHHIECQNQQELPKWQLYVLWHVTQAPRGLREHLDWCKEISTPYSWRDTFVEGFPIEASDCTWLFIKKFPEKVPVPLASCCGFLPSGGQIPYPGVHPGEKLEKATFSPSIDCHNTLVFFLKNTKYNSWGLYLLSSSC